MNVIIGIILFCMALGLIVRVLYEVGKKQMAKDLKLEAEYCKLFNDIQKEIDTFSVLTENRDLIRSQLNALSEMEWKYKEKTSAIWNNFIRKFYPADTLRDKLTKIEVDRFDAVNSFEG